MSEQRSPDQPILTPEDVAKIFNVSRDIVIRWVLADFGPPYCLIGNEIRYKRDEVIAWKEANWKREKWAQVG